MTDVSSPDPVDFYGVFDDLTASQRMAWRALREMLAEHVAPVADQAWLAGAFPREVIPAFGTFARQHLAPDGYQWPPTDPLLMGLVKLELGRVDPSMASFFAVHWGLTMSCIAAFGSDDQRERWLDRMVGFEAIGSFALSEPLVGSDAARGLTCTATREGDGWRLRGEKKWSGNATIADVLVIIAKGDDGEVLGFLVEPDRHDVVLTRIDDKIAKRSVENVVIHIDTVLPDAARLPGLKHFGQVAATLGMGRFAVAWEACGIAMGAYEAAHRYAMERQQFGRPIAGFQLVQDKLVTMLSEITMMQCFLMQAARAVRSGRFDGGQAAMAKRTCAQKMRVVVSLAREVLGGNGILVEHGVAKLFADAEAVYSYEGTHEMNTLIVGRQITGLSAFT